MLYDPMADKTTVIEPVTVEDFKWNPEIRKARSRLLAAVSIQLVLSTLRFVLAWYIIVFLRSNKTESMDAFVVNVFRAVILTIQDSIFINVVTKYRRTIILVFAWLTVIELINSPIEMLFQYRKLVSDSRGTDDSESFTAAVVMFIVAYVFFYAPLILTAIFSFKLVKLMKIPKVSEIV